MLLFMSESKAMILGVSGTELTDDERAFLSDERPWGLILFARNIAEPDQVRDLVADLRECAGNGRAPVFIDQEGGRVQRLRAPWTEWPPMRQLGARSPEATARFARALAVELRDCGFDLDFAPVVDVDSNPDNPVIRPPLACLPPCPTAWL